MAFAKEIRSKITSVKKTQKITKAMELVAASKMRKAQDRMQLTRPYARKIRQVVGHLANGHSEYHHPYLIEREVRRVGVIVVSTDRGLCGNLNNGLFKAVTLQLRDWEKLGIIPSLCLIGNKAVGFFRRLKAQVLGMTTHLGDSPDLSDTLGVTKVMLDAFDKGEIDVLYIAYNDFINTMKQKPVIQQLLPLVPEASDTERKYWDYVYEPDARDLIDGLLRRYIESQVFQSVVENIASEQAARMVAMKSATDNAGEIIEELRLAYNKVRQAAITREIAEIVSGADAV